MSKRLVFSQEQKALITQMVSEGKELFSVAKALGVTKRMLLYRCTKEITAGHDIAIKNGVTLPKWTGLASRREDVPEETKFQVQAMAELGLPLEHIAIIVGMSKMSLEAYCSDEIAAGRANGHQKVASKLFDMAVDGEHPAMTTFYLKAKAGWKETTSVEFPDANGVPQKVAGDQFNLNLSTEKLQILIAALNEQV